MPIPRLTRPDSVLHDAREIQAVRDLVSTYIQDARSIILYVKHLSHIESY